MLAFRQIIDDPLDVIPVPIELRHRPTEVIFIALDSCAEVGAADKSTSATPPASRARHDGPTHDEAEPFIVDEGGVWVAQVMAVGDLEAAIDQMRAERTEQFFSHSAR